MNSSAEKPDLNRLEEAHRLQSWVRRYAQNRSLPLVAFLVVFAMLFAAIGLPAYFGGIAFHQGNYWLGAVCAVVMFLAIATDIYISVPAWGGRRLQRFSENLSARAGYASIVADHPAKPIGQALAIVFIVCVAATVLFGVLGLLPIAYMQPISALYVVPFLVTLNFLMRPISGYVPLVWPLLYAVHAVLIVAGAPIVFATPWDFLNMLIPTIGYGLITALACHLYGRYALHRARNIVSHQLERAEMTPDGDQN